ncbi:hypothetical protein OkiPb00197_11700 [Escherichia coli]
MTKEYAQGVFIRFIDFRGELLLRASAIDAVAQAEKKSSYSRLCEQRTTDRGASVPDRSRSH